MDNFYVYFWFYKNTNEVFYIGKGKGNRFLERKAHRNEYFKNILNKEKDNVDVKIFKGNLTENDAFELEKKLIKEYKEKGQAKANLHEGGCGGNTGNYDNPIRSKKLSDFAKSRVGEKNPMWGKTHTEEVKRKLREVNLGKKLTQEHKDKLIKANTNRVKTKTEIEKLRLANLGKKLSKESYEKMMDKNCPYLYEVFFNEEKIFECLGHTQLFNFCHNRFDISRTIIEQIIKKEWKPKFQKHQKLSSLKILKTERSVSTKGDECSLVG